MVSREKMIHHIECLREKHDELDVKINDLYQHHADDMKVEELKKKKLKLKDEIEQSLTKLNKLI